MRKRREDEHYLFPWEGSFQKGWSRWSRWSGGLRWNRVDICNAPAGLTVTGGGVKSVKFADACADFADNAGGRQMIMYSHSNLPVPASAAAAMPYLLDTGAWPHMTHTLPRRPALFVCPTSREPSHPSHALCALLFAPLASQAAEKPRPPSPPRRRRHQRRRQRRARW